MAKKKENKETNEVKEVKSENVINEIKEMKIEEVYSVDDVYAEIPTQTNVVKKGKLQAVLKIEKKNDIGHPYFSHKKDFDDALNRKVVEMIQEAKRRAIGRGAKRLSPHDL